MSKVLLRRTVRILTVVATIFALSSCNIDDFLENKIKEEKEKMRKELREEKEKLKKELKDSLKDEIKKEMENQKKPSA